jgi:hypothetical protein
MSRQPLTEKRFLEISPKPFTMDGTSKGVVTVGSSCYFKVGQVVIIYSDTQLPQNFKVKRVHNKTSFSVGPVTGQIQERSDMSAYLVAENATVSAIEQKRPVVPEHEITRYTYEEEPTIARRVFMVDCMGEGYRIDNPLPVTLSDGSINIGTVNAEIEVQLTHLDNWPDIGDIFDSVRIGDGQDLLAINPDGSINVNVSSGIATTSVIYKEANIFTDTTEKIVATYTTVNANVNVVQMLGDADTYGTWRMYKNAMIVANMFGVARTSPTRRNGKLYFQRPEIIPNLGDTILVTFQPDLYRTKYLGASANTFVRIEGFV